MNNLIKILRGSFLYLLNQNKITDELKILRNVNDLYNDIKKMVEANDFLSLENLGYVKYNETKFPINLVKYRNNTYNKNQKHILIDAGIHGNEPAGVEFVKKLINDLKNKNSQFTKFDIDILPLINPWGWTHDIRYNKDKHDLNRDFLNPKSQEAKIILNFIHKNPYDIIFDLHEDPAAEGVYIYQYANNNKNVIKGLLTEIKEIGYKLENNVYMVFLKTKNGLINVPLWSIKLVNKIDRLSFSNYCRIHNSKNVFTIETPPKLDLDKRVYIHEKSIKFLLEKLL
jgi:hypothetical protein